MHVQMSTSVDAATVESARYALIRRLSYVFRHHLVVNLQPLGMICQVLRHRLGATSVAVSSIRESIEQVERLVGSSIQASDDVMLWLTADARLKVALGVAVGECVSNLRSSLSFRGFVIRYEESPLTFPVGQTAVREVLTAALIASTDHANGLSELVVNVAVVSDTVEISIQTRRGDQESCGEQDAYRLIEWDDVAVLAASHRYQFLKVSNEFSKIQLSAAA